MNLKKLTAAAAAFVMLCTMNAFPVSAAEENTVLTETESNNTLSVSNELPLNASVQGALETRDDVDYYRLDLKEDGKLDVRFSIAEAITTSTIYTYWSVSLVDTDGNTIRSCNIGGANLTSNLQSTGLEAGTYYLSVSVSTSYSAAAYTLTTVLDTASEWETEYNETFAAADVLTPGTPMNGNLYAKSDKDTYLMTLTEDSKVDFKFTLPSSVSSSTIYTYWVITLFDEEGTSIISYEADGSKITYNFHSMGLKAGNYYIQITSDSYSSSNYTLTASAAAASEAGWETEGNNSFANANEFSAAAPISGWLHSSSDSDYYKLTLAENSAVDFTFTIEEIITDSTAYNYWDIEIYTGDGSGTVLKSYTVYGNMLNYPITTLGLEAGTYYVRIYKKSSYYYSSQNYTLKAAVTENPDFESEGNDTFSNADMIPLDTPFSGNLQNKSDKDYYRFTLEEDAAVNFQFAIGSSVTSSTAYEYWNITLYDAQGNAVVSKDIDGSKLIYDLLTYGLDKGDYYLCVTLSSSYYYSSQTYTLTVSEIKDELWEGEANNTMSEADDLAVNTPINGRIHASKGKDYYKLAMDKAGTLNISFVIEPNSSNTNEYWQVTLMDKNGTSLLTKAISGENATVSLPAYEAQADTYYILIENDSYYYWTTQYTLTAGYEEKAYVVGDVNEDGTIDASDAAQILAAAAKIGSGADGGLTPTQEASANVNADEAIDATDAAAILRYAAAAGSGNEDAVLEDFI